ncbi:Succinylornithine transaminase [Rhodanobacter lindaniclasticus]
MTSAEQDLLNLGKRYWLPVYKPCELVLDHGRGSRVWDTQGRDYIDFGAGIAVNSLGHPENPQGKFTLVFLAAPDSPDAEVELTYNWDSAEDYGSARNFGHLAFRVEDVRDLPAAAGHGLHHSPPAARRPHGLRAFARSGFGRTAAGRPPAAARAVGIHAQHRHLVNQPRAPRNAPRAASSVSAMSWSLCALDMNPASNAEGARYAPRFSMPWKKRLNSATSAAVACA